MNLFYSLFTILFFTTQLTASSTFHLSATQAEQIGQKIWDNECKGKTEPLTWWNEGEEFASLGIHHFIWYPKDKKGPFEETFPALLGYMQKHGVVVPGWLCNLPACPWNTRKEFMSDFDSEKMVGLRKFLLRTKAMQTQFIAYRLQNGFPKMFENPHVKKQFHRVLGLKKGPYILLDYYNFKGSGLIATERYNDLGWGLTHVLEEMQDNDNAPDYEFVRAAKKILERRVANSPEERNEKRWLQGWLNRLKTYE